MNSPESDQTIFMTRSAGLARIFSLDDADTDLWGPEEMEAMWQHQLSAPIDVDLDSLVSVSATQLRKSPALESFRGKSFAELLAHPNPPIEALKLTKEFAKQTLKDSDESQLKEVASALYYASYAAGLARCGQLIGSMSHAELLPGFNWALKQPWLDPATKELVSEARALVSQKAT